MSTLTREKQRLFFGFAFGFFFFFPLPPRHKPRTFSVTGCKLGNMTA